ncbi:tether containing UBX domain for GLUT4 isoform X2 [Chelonus insularis]|uniref:tether containing UBX domain for GLUT4 isoform X2 n=1 Tax=Chelonus insularis TaxID=460826 RepID=UPI00158D9D28|nr:tether containing UBX domain for GLUT4 isoform X2 [Chelonus insularis]
MAASKSVTVIAPNGRHQNVKITPNTTILQVLEEVCQKQGYSSKKWDLKHFNRVLDVSSIIRFTALPNNAQLEMTPRTAERQASVVTVGIQLENGQRLMGDFPSDSSLSEIISNLCPAEDSADTVLIYMHQEIHGKENLDNTTLQSLGLNNGRGMLRLLHRDPEKLTTQAHVAGQLNPKSNQKSKENNLIKKGTAIASQIKKSLDPVALLRMEKNNTRKTNNGGNSRKKMPGGGYVLGKGDSKSESTLTAQGPSRQSESKPPQASTELVEDKVIESKDEKIEEQINFMDERNALVFNQAGAQAIAHEDLPDSFFDLTVDDAKALIRDAKRQREQLENAPLTTNTQRELDRNTSTLSKLHKYRRTILRIQFPNQMVLQGVFGPLETVEAVKDFVKKYLVNSDQDFTLYCTPPRKNLTPQCRLIEENLVPSAIIYYSGASELKPELQSKLVDPKHATLQAMASRK